MSTFKIALAQINPLVGDIEGNTQRILKEVNLAIAKGCHCIVFPELTLTGYPPEDLLLRPSIQTRVDRSICQICDQKLPIIIILGFPKIRDGQLFNMAGVIENGNLVFEYAKHCLPNYQVFDEKRYFVPGVESGICELKGIKIGISICEDIWDGSPLKQYSGIELLINLNASPFHQNKQMERESLIGKRARELGVPICYVNQVGGQDELVFDGGTMMCNAHGEVQYRSEMFKENISYLEFNPDTHSILVDPVNESKEAITGLESDYSALVIGVRDYVNKNRFKGVILGLSGGIDSALTLAIAADALGPDRVEAVMMPFAYTSDMSKNDAADEAQRLGVKYRSIDIESIYGEFIDSLSGAFENTKTDTTEQNLQARIRGVLLMALSNKLGYLVLTTGNKSEMAVGYATLYGDMAGGLDVLKDVPKTRVFELAKYRNSISEVIPESVITRPPSAELAPDQIDEDSLPPYEILDSILELYVEKDSSFQDIVDKGFEPEVVKRVLRLVDLNEYKRRQAPIGIRLSERAFGRDRRYPITNGWHIGD